MPDRSPVDEIVPEPPPKRGCTWLGCLVVLIIIAVLAGMLLPVIGMSSDASAQYWKCGKSQSQIFSALISYQTEFDTRDPGPIDPTLLPVRDAHHARLVTHQVLGILARQQRLPFALLTCPKSKRPRLAAFPGARPPLTWGIDPGSATYAFDWACPQDPPASRVVVADRDQTAHDGHVLVTFGDAHVSKVKLVSRPAVSIAMLITEGIDGKPLAGAAQFPADYAEEDPPEARMPDDIYSTDGDRVFEDDPLQPGGASARRAWVK